MEISYPDNNRIGKLSIPYSVLHDGRERPMLQALFGLCVVLHTEPNESGRGTDYYAASDLFDPIAEGQEVPEYRLIAWPGPAEAEPGPNDAPHCIVSGKYKFRAVRKIIVRVPALNVDLRPLFKAAHGGRVQ